MTSRTYLLVLLVALVPAAYADADQPAPAQTDETEARTLFGLGNTAYNEGRYQAALDYFQHAYDLSHRPGLLYNIGQAADRLRQDRRALEAFETFLREVPGSPQQSAIEARVTILRAAIAEADAAAVRTAESNAAVVSAPPAPSNERETPSRTPGFILAGSGGAVVIVGVVMLALGMGDASDVEDVADGTPYTEIRGAYDRAPLRITVGSVLAGVGLAATATGIVLAVRKRDTDDTARVELRATPTGLSLRGTF